MIKYVVGERFPHEKYLKMGEVSIAMLNDSFFDINICLKGISSNEINAVTKGKMKVSLFESMDIPFIILDFGNRFILDVSIDITKITAEQAQKWLTSESNIINIYLVDTSTGLLKGMRTISINFSEDLKKILKKQIVHTDVEDRISKVLSKYSTIDMSKLSFKYMKFER